MTKYNYRRVFEAFGVIPRTFGSPCSWLSCMQEGRCVCLGVAFGGSIFMGMRECVGGGDS